MKHINKHSFSMFRILAILAFIFSLQIQAQGDPVKGKILFNANCAACHQLDSRLVGPALRGVTEQRDRDWLKTWIKDSKTLIESGDTEAKALFDEYNNIPMPSYLNFSDKDLEDVIAYMANPKSASNKKTTTTGDILEQVKKGKKTFNANCAACHKLDGKLVGPSLRNIAKKRKKAWLYKWIKDSQALVKSGDADAKAIFDKYKIPMPSYPNLSDEDIDAVLAYTSYGTPKKNELIKQNSIKYKKNLNIKSSFSILLVLGLIALL